MTGLSKSMTHRVKAHTNTEWSQANIRVVTIDNTPNYCMDISGICTHQVAAVATSEQLPYFAQATRVTNPYSLIFQNVSSGRLRL